MCMKEYNKSCNYVDPILWPSLAAWEADQYNWEFYCFWEYGAYALRANPSIFDQHSMTLPPADEEDACAPGAEFYDFVRPMDITECSFYDGNPYTGEPGFMFH